MKRPCLLAAAFAVCLSLPAQVSAQETERPPPTPPIFSTAALARALGPVFEDPDGTPASRTAKPDGEAGRRCPGCPVRRLIQPYLESILLDAFYNTTNRVRGDGTANVSFTSVWHNLRHGFEWDLNDWGTNQMGHPYQGSNYFTSGRAHGLTFWESAPVAAFGSATWEYLAENNRASLNDFINTTVGGIALGEVMHRIGWLIRDPMLTGKGRSRKELLAMAVDPMGGLQRLTSGDRKRVAPKPDGMIPSSVTTRGGAGVIWQGRSVREAQSSAQPFLEMDMDYGDARNGRSTVPFDAFTLEFTAGGGSPVSLANVRGRYFGRPFGNGGKAQFSVFQTFDYATNKAYAIGGQGVEVEVATTRKLSSGASLWMAATGGSTILGAVDTLIPALDTSTEEPVKRDYDYGPTIRFGGVLELQRHEAAVARLSYQGYQISVVDGNRAFHVLQRMRLDIRVPLARRIALGVAGEYFFRKAYFWAEGIPNRTDQSPQFRIFAAWRQKTVGAQVQSQTARAAPLQPAPQSPVVSRVGSKWWFVGGGGFSMARAGCATCPRTGVFTNTKGLFFDIGGRVTPRVDAGVEVMAVRARLEENPLSAPIRTTFILGIAQFRPRLDSGFYMRAGMGVGFAGNGILNPNGPALKPPYTTNALGVTYGLGWIFRREHRWTIQANFAHHIAALGELQPENGAPVKNVVGNYWMSGIAIGRR